MPIFGQDFYGLAKYGAPVSVDFKVDPFVARPDGYNTIRLTWTPPSGAWTSFRLVKNKSGYPANQNDGVVLIDTTGSSSEYVDNGLTDNAFYFYAIWIKNSNGWFRAGTASTLSVANVGMSDLLWDRIPRWFHYSAEDSGAGVRTWSPTAEIISPDSPYQENQDLRSFLRVLGFGFDYLHNYHDTVTWAMDPKRAHLQNVDLLAKTLGADYEYEVPGRIMRERVANAGNLAQQRGTLEGLRGLVNATVGWDVDLSVTNNLFLNRDQSTFANPLFPVWDTGVNYKTNDLVTFQGYIFKALSGNYNTTPAPNGASNATWQNVTQASSTLLTPKDSTGTLIPNTVSTWRAYSSTNTALSTAGLLTLSYGVSSPVDTGSASNALNLTAVGGASSNYYVSATTAQSGIDVVRQGVPLPRATAWDAATTYSTGAFVFYNQVSYRAIEQNTGRVPNLFTEYWERVGVDKRLPVQFSYWAHAGYSVAAGSGAVTKAGLTFYDGRGVKISGPFEPNATFTPDNAPIYDSFNTRRGTTLDGQTDDLQRGLTWSAPNWRIVLDNDGHQVAAPISGSGDATFAFTSGASSSSISQCVGATFRKKALGTRKQYLVVNKGATTSLVVSRTGVGSVDNTTGAYTEVAAFTTPVADQQRVVAQLFPSTGVINIWVDGVQVLQNNHSQWLLGNSPVLRSGIMVL